MPLYHFTYGQHSWTKTRGGPNCTQSRAQPDQCYVTVQITAINFECSL